MLIDIQELIEEKTPKFKKRQRGRKIALRKNGISRRKQHLDLKEVPRAKFQNQILIGDSIEFEMPDGSIFVIDVNIVEYKPRLKTGLWSLIINTPSQFRPYRYERLKSKEVAMELAQIIVTNLIQEIEFYLNPNNRDMGDAASDLANAADSIKDSN